MAAHYQARHRARHRAGSPGWRGAFNGPLTSAAALVAVAGVGAASVASSLKVHTAAASSTAGRAAPARAPRAVAPGPSAAGGALDRDRKASADRAARTQTRQDILSRVRSKPQAVARLLADDEGWGEKQFTCLDNLWTRESGWRWDADNPTSDAYGIPQSLPGSKMASVDGDWRTNPLTQIKWGLKYISYRYGTPCSAWSHWQGKQPHWY